MVDLGRARVKAQIERKWEAQCRVRVWNAGHQPKAAPFIPSVVAAAPRAPGRAHARLRREAAGARPAECHLGRPRIGSEDGANWSTGTYPTQVATFTGANPTAVTIFKPSPIGHADTFIETDRIDF